MVVVAILFTFRPALADVGHDHGGTKRVQMSQHRSLSDTRITWPSSEELWRVVTLRDYNTRMVFLGTLLLGVCAGLVGTFTLLRKRALVGDVVGHAALPGVAVAFLVMETIQPGTGKWMPGLLLGALVAGLLGVLCTLAIRRYTRIKEDACLAIVLSVFFGVGIALFTVIQDIPSGTQAGLKGFIYGQPHALVTSDVYLIGAATLVVLILSIMFFKEFSLLCFDESYATAQGWPVLKLDILLMLLVVGVTVIGLQCVGLILVVALLIIPAASARFWTENVVKMTILSAAFGGLSSSLGVTISALFPNMVTGAVIVLVGGVIFLCSMFLGIRRGVLLRVIAFRKLRRNVGRHDLLRAWYEHLESMTEAGISVEQMTAREVTFNELHHLRSWSSWRLKQLLFAARANRLVKKISSGVFQLTERGAEESRRVARNHRLWEMYLITYADIAHSHVDRDADQIEHILQPDLIDELNSLLSLQYPEMAMPPSPHALAD